MLSVAPLWAQTAAMGPELTGAVIIEQGITFAVVIVRKEALNDTNFADEIIRSLEPTFGGVPVVLMVQDAQGTPSYYGRKDIAQFMSTVPLENIPWKNTR